MVTLPDDGALLMVVLSVAVQVGDAETVTLYVPELSPVISGLLAPLLQI